MNDYGALVSFSLVGMGIYITTSSNIKRGLRAP
jgi:hypothetical protein